jgi:hypothetical protein
VSRAYRRLSPMDVPQPGPEPRAAFIGAHTREMAIMVVCGLVVASALVLAVRWRNYAFVLDPGAGAPGPTRLKGLARVLAIGYLTGLVTGVLVIGPAGRLAMRLLAATSPDAQGRITEADEVVGRITVGGTIGFVLFVGFGVGLAVGLVYVFVALVFPRGLLGGAIYGATLLVLFSWWLDPLNADNPDFDIVGPGWLAVATFAAIAVVTGVVTAVVAGRIDAALREPPRRWLWWAVPIGVFGAPAMVALTDVWPALVIVGVGCLVYVCLPMAEQPLRRRGRVVLQAVLGAAVLVTLPGFLSAVVDIA